MVFTARDDVHGAVKNFVKHHPHQLVREGHGRDGEPHLAGGLDPVRQAVGGADDQVQLRVALQGDLLHPLRQRLGGEHLALNAQGDGVGTGWDLLKDLVGLRLKSLADLPLAGALRQTNLLDGHPFHPAVSPKALFIFRNRFSEVAFLQLPRSDQTNRQHSRPSLYVDNREMAPRRPGRVIPPRRGGGCAPYPCSFAGSGRRTSRR